MNRSRWLPIAIFRQSLLTLAACFGVLSPGVLATESLPELPRYEMLRTATPPRIDGRLDEPCWVAAPALQPFHFTWYEQGDREQTIVKMLWDDQYVYIAHICQDAHITARYEKHDDPVPEDDCFEIMLAPNAAHETNYFNVEWNLKGAYVDGHRPAGPEGPRVAWDVAGLRMAGTYEGTLNDDSDQDRWWIVEVAIPLANFASWMSHMPPRAGDQWRVNFNRHGGATNFQYSQWSAGDTPTPAFHTPHRFGFVTFSARESPFEALPVQR